MQCAWCRWLVLFHKKRYFIRLCFLASWKYFLEYSRMYLHLYYILLYKRHKRQSRKTRLREKLLSTRLLVFQNVLGHKDWCLYHPRGYFISIRLLSDNFSPYIILLAGSSFIRACYYGYFMVIRRFALLGRLPSRI